ncbi:MAG: signal peptidase II [Candidatus Omnitrophica bacterium]|nr:signal peptidase II [Candidatus Omnitrophota bacterium]
MSFLLLGLAVFLVDRVTKIITLTYLTIGDSTPLIKGVFHLTLVENRGGAFGLFKGVPIVFLIVSLVTLLLIIGLSQRIARRPAPFRISLGLIAGGAAGNLFDRIAFGHVIDFLDFRVWPVFNIADSAITIGVALLLWDTLNKKRLDSKDASDPV